jgi:D-sedoheptulose 7-phosphate isomerase
LKWIGDKVLVSEIRNRIEYLIELTRDPNCFPEGKLETLARQVLETFERGGKIAFVGNGGSAAEAIHLAAEFTGKCVIPHDPVSALCLNESQSALTAIGNDYGFQHVFSRQVTAHLKNGDVLIALSTSGKSANIVEAIKCAHAIGVKSHLWMGDYEVGELTELADIWKVPAKSTPRIQEIHLVWGHILAEVVEMNL